MASEGPTLDYACTEWLQSTQAAWNIYNTGRKLWTREDLHDIEQQLAHGNEREYFTVRMIDGRIARIKNPMFGEQSPIWKPVVKYRDFWQLVYSKAEASLGTNHCSYLVEWQQVLRSRAMGLIQDWNSDFEESRNAWNKSTSCDLVKLKLREIFNIETATKVLCFGLGDMCVKPPWWAYEQNPDRSERDIDLECLRPCMIQHAIALTIADMCLETGASKVELLAQDPAYTNETKELLKKNGFSVVGEFGAGGFAEIDDNSVVFSYAIPAPLKQIVADIARPRLVITMKAGAQLRTGLKWADGDSPRSELMWQDYDQLSCPVSSEDDGVLGPAPRGLYNILFYVRKAGYYKNSAIR